MYLNSPNVQPMWYIKILAGFECTYPVPVHFRNTHIAVQKLTTLFKNVIFEKRRQFLNRILGRNIRGFEQQAEWIEYLNMLVSIKILARILMLHIGCTFGEWCEKLFTRQNQKNYINCVRTGF